LAFHRVLPSKSRSTCTILHFRRRPRYPAAPAHHAPLRVRGEPR
jgi:hypothetical protein